MLQVTGITTVTKFHCPLSSPDGELVRSQVTSTWKRSVTALRSEARWRHRSAFPADRIRLGRCIRSHERITVCASGVIHLCVLCASFVVNSVFLGSSPDGGASGLNPNHKPSVTCIRGRGFCRLHVARYARMDESGAVLDEVFSPGTTVKQLFLARNCDRWVFSRNKQ